MYYYYIDKTATYIVKWIIILNPVFINTVINNYYRKHRKYNTVMYGNTGILWNFDISSSSGLV